MWKIFIDKLDSIDKHLMLLLNYDGGYITRRTKLRLALIICVFVVSNSNMKAEEFKDSIPVGDHPFQSSSKEESKLDKFSSSRLYQMTYVGVPLVAAGLIIKREDDHFRSLRNDYMPKFRNHTDDYLQFAPAAVMLGLKTAGVEGRSSWGRMLVSDAFAVMLMGGVVNTLKTTTHVMRPDGSNNHSFPSGHTATAFMTATMLSKEYGHKSPWISIGAYFFNPYLGIGGQFTVSNTALISNGDKAEENSFDAVSLCGGSYFSYPLSQRWAIGSKLLCGFVHYPRLELSNVTVDTRNGVCFGSGLSCSFKANKNYGIRFFLDYNLQPSHNKASGEWMNTLACGASFALLL